MVDTRRKLMARTSLLLALTLICQSLRFFLPVPVFFSTLIIGALVNACLLVALKMAGLGPALVIALITPIVAYFQQVLPIPIFIVPVAVGNSLYVWLYDRLERIGPAGMAIGAAAAGKAAFFYLAFSWLLGLIQLPPLMASAIMFIMSWPQLATGIAGGLLAHFISRRLLGALGNDLGEK